MPDANTPAPPALPLTERIMMVLGMWTGSIAIHGKKADLAPPYALKELMDEVDALVTELRSARQDAKRLRHMLWLNHGHAEALYGDDGERQCKKCRIDYNTSSVDEIEQSFDRQMYETMQAMGRILDIVEHVDAAITEEAGR